MKKNSAERTCIYCIAERTLELDDSLKCWGQGWRGECELPVAPCSSIPPSFSLPPCGPWRLPVCHGPAPPGVCLLRMPGCQGTQHPSLSTACAGGLCQVLGRCGEEGWGLRAAHSLAEQAHNALLFVIFPGAIVIIGLESFASKHSSFLIPVVDRCVLGLF